MRRLLIDAGNSAIKWAVSDGSGWLATGVVPHIDSKADQASLQTQWAAQAGSIAAAYGCYVVSDELVSAIELAARRSVRWYRSQPRFESARTTLSNGYRDPMQLGADRWHAMIAAADAYRGESLLVVGAGSATTLDCVRSESESRAQFLGGRIAPGVQMMFEALARGTARLPLADGQWVACPTDTDDAIASGVLDAQLGLIERACRSCAAAAGRAPRIVISGGHARRLAEHLQRMPAPWLVSIEDNLVLRGIELRIDNDP